MLAQARDSQEDKAPGSQGDLEATADAYHHRVVRVTEHCPRHLGHAEGKQQ
jgi:hypothetical protein